VQSNNYKKKTIHQHQAKPITLHQNNPYNYSEITEIPL